MSTRYLLASILVFLASGSTQAQTGSDTLPVRVVERAINGYKSGSLDATFAPYDTVFIHETLGDAKGAEHVRRADWIRQMKSDTMIVRVMHNWRITHIERGTRGPWVFDIWTLRGPKGKTAKHVDILEVRNGKIVREIEG
jgi:hypothetical protein